MDDALEQSMDGLEISGSGTFGTDSELEDSLDSLFGKVKMKNNTTRESKLKLKPETGKVLGLKAAAPHDLRMSRGVNAMTQITPRQLAEQPKKKKKGRRVRKDDGKYSATKYSTANISFGSSNRARGYKTTSGAGSSNTNKSRVSQNAGAWISSSMELSGKKTGSSIRTTGKGYSAKNTDRSSCKHNKHTPTEIATQTGSGGSTRKVRVTGASKSGAMVMNKTESTPVDSSQSQPATEKGKWDSGDQRQRNMRQEVLRNELGLSSRPSGTGNTATRAVFFM